MSKGGLLDLVQTISPSRREPATVGDCDPNEKLVLRYKIAVFGPAGAGKTATIATLCRRQVPERHIETPGIQINRLVWPLAIPVANAEASDDKLSKETTFVLDFWDCGSAALSRFDYLRENMLRHADAALFVVSACDRRSFHSLPRSISRTLKDRRNSILTIALCTHIDEPFNVEVFEQERIDLGNKWSDILVDSICNTPLTYETPNRNYASLIAPKVNLICQRLSAHDQNAASAVDA